MGAKFGLLSVLINVSLNNLTADLSLGVPNWDPNFGWIQAAYGRSGRGSVSQRKPELLRASDSLGILCFATANNLLNLLFAIFLIPKCFSVNCLMLL